MEEEVLLSHVSNELSRRRRRRRRLPYPHP